MVETAAAAHRVLLQGAQARRGLARAANARARARDAAHEFMRRRRHSGKMADEIERHPFGRKHGAGGTRHRHERGLRRDGRPIARIGRDLDLACKLGKSRGHERQPRDHARLARDHDCARRRVLRDGGDRGDVAGAAKILGERARDRGIDLERRQEGIRAEKGACHYRVPADAGPVDQLLRPRSRRKGPMQARAVSASSLPSARPIGVPLRRLQNRSRLPP